MFCKKCGREIHDEAVICPNCGCSTGNSASEFNGEDTVNAGLMVASILVPLIGIILGIVNLCKKKTKSGTAYLIAGIVAWAIATIILNSL